MAPFPWAPMIAISAAFLSHTFSLTGLYPYVGYMVEHVGATDDKDRAGGSWLSFSALVGAAEMVDCHHWLLSKDATSLSPPLQRVSCKAQKCIEGELVGDYHAGGGTGDPEGPRKRRAGGGTHELPSVVWI